MKQEEDTISESLPSVGDGEYEESNPDVVVSNLQTPKVTAKHARNSIHSIPNTRILRSASSLNSRSSNNRGSVQVEDGVRMLIQDQSKHRMYSKPQSPLLSRDSFSQSKLTRDKSQRYL